MSYVIRACVAALPLFVVACSASHGEISGATSSSSLATAGEVTLTFAADWSEIASGPLAVGGRAKVSYDVSRLTACRGDLPTGPGWSITGHYRIAGGPIGSFEAGGLSPSHGTAPPIIELTSPGDLEIWFENTSAWGCDAFDSDYGRNYHFTVAPSPSAPGWMGNASYAISRASCGGDACDGDVHSLADPFVYDTWARQRAVVAGLFFEVWKQGVTDFDNPDLWRQLDVQAHTRIGGVGAFTKSYVNFDRRVGNNARYAVSLRDADPLPGAQGGGALTDKSQCPTFPTRFTADGQYIVADVEVYFTVNGVELRPAPNAAYRGSFQNYRGLYAVCEKP